MDFEKLSRSYQQNGFEIVPNVFSSKELKPVQEEVQRYLQEEISRVDPGEVQYEDSAAQEVRCVFRMHYRSDFLRRLLEDSRLTQIVQALFGNAQVVPDGVMLIDKAPNSNYVFPYHQDNAYQFWSPPEAVAATLALDQVSRESGTIICLKGSHRIGVLPHEPSGIRGASLGVVEAPDTDRFPEVPLTLQAGDVSLHHVNVIHRTGANQTSHQRRNLGLTCFGDRGVARILELLRVELALAMGMAGVVRISDIDDNLIRIRSY